MSSTVEMVERYGLSPSTARPPIPEYVRRLWQRRYFIYSFATSRAVAKYSGARLGMLWQVLTPVLYAGIYVLIFGVLLHTTRGVENFVAFVVTGVFVMHFTQRSVSSGARSITSNLNLIRALHFPRAALPLAATLVELQQMLVALVILGVIVLGTGEPLTWSWLLLPLVIALQTVFNLGATFFIARIGSMFPDITNLLPFVLRVWLYMSGVMFPIHERMHGWVADLFLINPAAVFLELARDSVMLDYHSHTPINGWVLAAVWSVVVCCAGFLYFWAGEETYGRG